MIPLGTTAAATTLNVAQIVLPTEGVLTSWHASMIILTRIMIITIKI